jgi:hypothetical protein
MSRVYFILERGLHFADDFVNYVLNGQLNVVAPGRCGGTLVVVGREGRPSNENFAELSGVAPSQT